MCHRFLWSSISIKIRILEFTNLSLEIAKQPFSHDQSSGDAWIILLTDWGSRSVLLLALQFHDSTPVHQEKWRPSSAGSANQSAHLKSFQEGENRFHLHSWAALLRKNPAENPPSRPIRQGKNKESARTGVSLLQLEVFSPSQQHSIFDH